MRNTNKLVSGVGINDIHPRTKMEKGEKAYKTWKNMLLRCYSEKYHKHHDSYIGCSVCDEWLRFSNFYPWFILHYTEGCALDKDILVKHNKIYSPQTCCFVPHYINSLLVKGDKRRGDYPIGVRLHKTNCVYFEPIFTVEKKQIYLGIYDNPNDAFLAYKRAKEDRIQKIASKAFANREISQRVYNALMNYKVEITD